MFLYAIRGALEPFSLFFYLFSSLFLEERKKKSYPFFFKDKPRRRRKETCSSFSFSSILGGKRLKSFALECRMTKSFAFCHSTIFSLTKKIENIKFPNLLSKKKFPFSFYTKMKTSVSLYSTLSPFCIRTLWGPSVLWHSKCHPFLTKKPKKGSIVECQQSFRTLATIVARRLLSQFCDPYGQKMTSFCHENGSFFNPNGSKISQISRLAKFSSPGGDHKK